MYEINKDKIIENLQGTGNVEFAYIFGSRVKNKARFGSDLDIALYFEKEPGLLKLGELVKDLEEISNCNIDLIRLNGLVKINPKLAFTVINEGILLFNNNNGLLVEYKKNAYLTYFDFEPVIDLFNRKLNERIYNDKFAKI